MDILDAYTRTLRANLLRCSTLVDDRRAKLLFDFRGADAVKQMEGDLGMRGIHEAYPEYFADRELKRMTQMETQSGTQLSLYNYTDEEVYFTENRELFVGGIPVMAATIKLNGEEVRVLPVRSLWKEVDCTLAIVSDDEGGFRLFDSELGNDEVSRYQMSEYGGIPLCLIRCLDGQ